MPKNRKRAGFTLVEMLVVIVILLIVASLTFAVFRGNSSDKLRSAARTAQSAFLGAKDRALHAKELRGVRLIRDTNGPTFIVAGVSNGIPSTVNGIVYLQPLPMQTTGNLNGAVPQNNVVVTRPGYPANTDATEIAILGAQATAWQSQDAGGIWPPGAVQVRVPSGNGPWMQLARQQNSPAYWWTKDSGGNLCLLLQVPYQGGKSGQANAIDSTDSNASIDIQLGNDVLAFHQPIPLSSGCVIDLQYSSPNVQTLAGASLSSGSPAPYVDIMFTPRGAVSGYLSGLGPLHFLMRDLKDATAGVNPIAVGAPGSTNPDLTTGDRLVLTVIPQTGLVQVFEIDPTDVLTNGTAAGPADGLADDLFNFAKQGKSAGR